jgi:DNA-binding IclR family transcriptional regulator
LNQADVTSVVSYKNIKSIHETIRSGNQGNAVNKPTNTQGRQSAKVKKLPARKGSSLSARQASTPTAKKKPVARPHTDANGALRYSAPALEKGLDILEFLSSRARAFSLAQLAEEMGRTKGEIFRMLVVLEARDYVERAPDSDDFQVTDKLLRVGLRRPHYRSLTEVARPTMDAFAAEMRYPCHLAIVSEEQIVVIARAESPDLVGVTVRVGYRQPLLETGSGRCIFSYLEDDLRRAMIARLRKANGKIDLAALDAEGETIRAHGHLIEESRVMEGVWDISCPVHGRENGSVVAALTTPYVRLVTNRISKEAVAQRLREAADEISRKLIKI